MKASRIVALLLPLSVAFSAQTGWAHGGGKRACRDDIKQFCPDITPGPDSFKSIHDCLKQNMASLSAPCQEHIAKMQAKVAAALQTCESDIQTLCSESAADTHATMKCLFEKRDSLSQACKDQLPRHRGGRHHHGKDGKDCPAENGAASQS